MPDEHNGNTLNMRLQRNLEDHNALAVRPYKLALSLGMAHYECAKPRTLESLMGEADHAMYVQKRQRKNGFAHA
jgi:GGDEF domain-containing protein